MSPLEPLDKWLRRRQADQCRRHVLTSRSLIRWPRFDVPTARRINCQHWQARCFERAYRGRERFSDLARKAEAKDGIDDRIRLLGRRREIVHERNVKRTQLRHEPGVQIAMRLLRVVDAGLVAEKVEVPRRHEPVATIVSRPARDQDALPARGRVQFVEALGDGEAGELHELVKREAAGGGHELGVEPGGILGGQRLWSAGVRISV